MKATQIGPAASPTVVNIRDFGAIGDGTTHPLSALFATLAAAQARYPAATALTNELDRVAMAAAIASLPAAGGTVTAPPGTFMMDAGIVVPDHVHIVGAGMYATTFKGTAACTDSVFQRNTLTALPTSSGSPAIGVHMHDFSIDGSAMPTSEPWGGGKGIYFAYLQRSSFQRLYIHDTPASCFGNDFQQSVTYSSCYAVNGGRGAPTGTGSYPGGNGFGFGTGAWQDESVFCSDCFATGCFYGGFVYEAVTNAALSRYMEFHNCRSYGNQFGFRFEGPGSAATGTAWAKLIGCSAVSNTKDGIGVASGTSHIIIADAISELNGQDGIYLDNPASVDINVHDCIVNNNTRHGVHVTSGYSRVHHNSVFLNGQNGIYVDSNSASAGRTGIDYNRVYNNGTAAIVGSNDGIRITPASGSITDFRVQGNRCFDDQGTPTQRYGFITTGSVDFLAVVDNDLRSNQTGAYLNSATGTHNSVRGNVGVNPAGPQTAPGVPATTVALTNPFVFDCTVFVAGGTVTAIAIGGTATGLTSGAFRVPAGQTITLTYSVAPSWTWFAD